MSCKTILCKSYRGNRIDKLKSKIILCESDCGNSDVVKCNTSPFKTYFGNRIEKLKCNTFSCTTIK